MDVSEAKRLKQLEGENAKLKKLLAEPMLDAAALRELLAKNGRGRRQARSCRASSGRDGPLGAAGLQHCRGRSKDGPLPIPPASYAASLITTAQSRAKTAEALIVNG
jgi:hypothetical protein